MYLISTARALLLCLVPYSTLPSFHSRMVLWCTISTAVVLWLEITVVATVVEGGLLAMECEWPYMYSSFPFPSTYPVLNQEGRTEKKKTTCGGSLRSSWHCTVRFYRRMGKGPWIGPRSWHGAIRLTTLPFTTHFRCRTFRLRRALPEME